LNVVDFYSPRGQEDLKEAYLLTFSLLAILTGCMMGPNYQRPDIDTPQSWRFEDKEAKELANTAWWEQFNDPVLNDLIQTALRENKDIKIAAARVEEFMGRYGVTRSTLFPQVFAGASAGRQRVSELTGPTPLEGQGNPTFSNYEVFLNASWEITSGARLRCQEATDLLSTEEARRTSYSPLSLLWRHLH
jgi:multidrug efflux system outer membrane protein